jgi:threonyl-tRNA synthetase
MTNDSIFLTWLAPVQVAILLVGERFLDHADRLAVELRAEFVRVEVNRSDDKVGKKVREAEPRLRAPSERSS